MYLSLFPLSLTPAQCPCFPSLPSHYLYISLTFYQFPLRSILYSLVPCLFSPCPFLYFAQLHASCPLLPPSLALSCPLDPRLPTIAFVLFSLPNKRHQLGRAGGCLLTGGGGGGGGGGGAILTFIIHFYPVSVFLLHCFHVILFTVHLFFLIISCLYSLFLHPFLFLTHPYPLLLTLSTPISPYVSSHSIPYIKHHS